MNPKIKFLIYFAVLTGLVLLGFSFSFFRRYYPNFSFQSFLRHAEEYVIEKAFQRQTPKETPKPETTRVPILVYHSVRQIHLLEPAYNRQFITTPDVFEKELRYLKNNGYAVISFNALVDHLLDNFPLPPKSVVITFDDGWQSQYVNAFPLLKKYGDTATFFIYTNAIGQKYFLTWQQVKNLDAAGMTIGSHTKSHPYLLKIDTKQRLKEEIAGGKQIIENQLGKKIDFFAYPFGHYNKAVIDAVKEAGYKAARSFYRGVYNTKDNLFTLKVISASNDFNKFVKDLNR